MRHTTDGALRRLLDEPAGVADADREHVAGCTTCLARLASAQEDAAATGAALELETAVDVEAGWSRLSHAAASDGRRRAAPARPARRRALLHSPLVAALCVAALLAGAGTVAAADWLQIFHTERVAPVAVSESDLVALPDLSAYGTVEVTERGGVRRVADAAAAERESGLRVPQVSELPRGVVGEPTFAVARRTSAVFTFSAGRAGGDTPPPAGLDGSRFRLVAGPGVAAVWAEARGVPALVVGRAVAPTAYSSGVPFATARDYLLSLPGLPDDLASQLRSFTGDGTTLPLPVPADRVSTSAADVDGSPATLFTARDGSMAGVVWVDGGVVTAVAGTLSAGEVLTVARGLR
jgi:hypothetical protein